MPNYLPTTMPKKTRFDHPFEQYAAYRGMVFEVLDGPYDEDAAPITNAQANAIIEGRYNDQGGEVLYHIRLENGAVILAQVEEIHADFSWG